MTQPYPVCPQCQTPSEPGKPFCSNCGRDLRTSESTPNGPTTSFGANTMLPVPPNQPYGPQGQEFVPPTQQYTPMPQNQQYAPIPQNQQYSAVPADINNKRVTAGILGILLGGLGVHKFILGKTQSGIIMLLVSILSCGFAAPIIALIGLVEGIMYLSKSDADFYQTYIVDGKEWL